MKPTTYRGLDYSGHTQANRNPETGIRYGVISQHSVMPEAMEDVYVNSRDLSFEAACSAAKHELESAVKDYIRKDRLAEVVESLWDGLEQGFADGYADGGEHSWRYERDGYILENCLQSDVTVILSPYFTYAQYCSPCVPGACNLDSPIEDATPADVRCYCLGHDWFEGGVAPYPVYSVEMGELVTTESGVKA